MEVSKGSNIIVMCYLDTSTRFSLHRVDHARRHKNGSSGAYSHSVFNKGVIYEKRHFVFLIVWPLSWEVPSLAV